MSLIDKMFSFRFQITFIVSNNHFNNLNDAKHRTYKKQKKLHSFEIGLAIRFLLVYGVVLSPDSSSRKVFVQ